jgi:formylglycine-generating enzyme required for sulfatase activity
MEVSFFVGEEALKRIQPKNRNDILDLRDHLARFPGGTTDRYALAKLDGLVWAGLGSTPKIQHLRAYLDEFPKGANAGAAQTRLATLEREAAEDTAAERLRAQETEAWNAVATSSDTARIEAFLEDWPTGQHAAAAKARIDDHMRARSRVLVDAAIVHNANGKWFLPGAGRYEWFKDHEAGPEMVVVPAGSFMMGSPVNEPERESWQKGTEKQHEVTIAQPFAVARHAITRGQFADFASATKHKIARNQGYIWKHYYDKPDLEASWLTPGFSQDDSHPVVCIGWDDARAYAVWLARTTSKPYRLLFEAEREYVTRAGTTTPFWWGSSITPGQANYDGRVAYKGGGSTGEWRKSTVSVGSFEANPWGLYNVHGNVWEWSRMGMLSVAVPGTAIRTVSALPTVAASLTPATTSVSDWPEL